MATFCNYDVITLAPYQSQENLKAEAYQSSQFLPVITLALTSRFWTQYFTVKRPRKCSVYEQVEIIQASKSGRIWPSLNKVSYKHWDCWDPSNKFNHTDVVVQTISSVVYLLRHFYKLQEICKLLQDIILKNRLLCKKPI